MSTLLAFTPALSSTLLMGQAAGDMAYAVPLVLAIAFVYSATRHELTGPILSHGFKLTMMLAGFMVLVFAVLAALSWAV